MNGFATRASEGEMIGRLLLTTKGGAVVVIVPRGSARVPRQLPRQ